MAIVNSITFTPDQGGIISDEESWYLRNRKTHHTRHLYPVVPPALTNAIDLRAVYGGVGNPEYHYEVMYKVQWELSRRVSEKDRIPATMPELGRVVLDCFNETSHRYANDRMRFLFDVSLDDVNRNAVTKDGEDHPMGQETVRKRGLKIANLEEKLEDAPLAPANHVCLVGWDPVDRFQGFCIKQEDGVLSFQGGGFESLGSGRTAGGMAFQKILGKMTLPQRHEGMGMGPGLVALVDSLLEAGEHFGQVGGNISMVLVDGTGKLFKDGLSVITMPETRLAMEIVKGLRRGYLQQSQAEKLLTRLLVKGEAFNAVEKALFSQAKPSRGLHLLLRGYKVDATSGEFRTNSFNAKK